MPWATIWRKIEARFIILEGRQFGGQISKNHKTGRQSCRLELLPHKFTEADSQMSLLALSLMPLWAEEPAQQQSTGLARVRPWLWSPEFPTTTNLHTQAQNCQFWTGIKTLYVGPWDLSTVPGLTLTSNSKQTKNKQIIMQSWGPERWYRVKVLALHAIKPGLIPGTTYGLPSPAGHDP